jgi:hypothetical protein
MIKGLAKLENVLIVYFKEIRIMIILIKKIKLIIQKYQIL